MGKFFYNGIDHFGKKILLGLRFMHITLPLFILTFKHQRENIMFR